MSQNRINKKSEKIKKITATCKCCKCSFTDFHWLDTNEEKCYRCYGLTMEDWTHEKRVQVVSPA